MSTTPPPSTAVPPAPPRPTLRQILPGFLLPLFFIVGLPLGLVSAFHQPTPHDLSLNIVGPAQVVTKIADGLDKTKEFSTTQTDVASEARSSVRNRESVGAIKVTVEEPAASSTSSKASTTAQAAPTFKVTTYVANAGGRSAAAAVEATGASVAEQLGTTTKIVDVAPLASTDTLGTTLFYILTYTSLGAYLVIIVLTQVLPKARLRTRFAVVTGAALVAPLLVFGLSSIFVGDYNASFGTIAALLGIDAISVFTVGTLAILIQSLMGNAAIFGVMTSVVFLNFPSAGGAVPASMLPPFWQLMHNIWFGAGAYESFRSIVYFGGAGLGRWLPQLLAWTVGALLVTFIVHLLKKVSAQRVEIADLKPGYLAHRHLQVEPSVSAGTPRDKPKPSLTTGTEAAR